MNDGVITGINVLRSVFQHIDAKGGKLVHLDNEDLFSSVEPYGEIVSEYLGSLTEEERKTFRDLRGVQGQTTRTRRCQEAIRKRLPDFDPPGLEEFLQLERAQTSVKAKEIIDRIEVSLQQVVLEELRRNFGVKDAEWWLLGIPKAVRLKVTQRFEEDDGRRGAKEHYFDLIDYRKIIIEQWALFDHLLGYGKRNSSKDKQTSWIAYLNEKRNLVAHASSGVALPMEDLNQLQEYDDWLRKQLANEPEEGDEE